MLKVAAACATAALLAGSLGVYAGVLVGERDAERTTVAAHLTPAAVEPCGSPVVLTADVALDEGEPIVVRLVGLDGEGHEHLLRVEAEAGTSLELPVAVPATYGGTDVPIVGRHLVRVERPDELLALGTLTVRPGAC